MIWLRILWRKRKEEKEEEEETTNVCRFELSYAIVSQTVQRSRENTV
jgi:hypothetical protein